MNIVMSTTRKLTTPNIRTKAARPYLEFKVMVANGFGSFSRLIFPGKTQLINEAPKDTSENFTPTDEWPEKLCQGSLNCKVTEFPDNFQEAVGDGQGIGAFDNGLYTPAFSIPHDMIGGNQFGPTSENPRKGIGQVWDCTVTKHHSTADNQFSAWHLRRVVGNTSGYLDVIELVSDRRLREAHALETGMEMTLKMHLGGK